jgi:hypothetical protein
MYSYEVINIPILDLHTKDRKRFKAPLFKGTKVGLFPRHLGFMAWDAIARIEEYSRKRLTKQSDILRAFMGILRAIEKGSLNIHHCFGVPIVPPPPDPPDAYITGMDRELRQKIFDSRKWSPFVGFCIGLCWDTGSSLTRRSGFPSWSWTGWHGSIYWVFREVQWKSIHGDADFQVQLQLHDAQVVTWDEFERSYSDLSSRLSGVLLVSAWVTPMVFGGTDEDSPIMNGDALLDLKNGGRKQWSFKLTSRYTPLLVKEGMAVHLGQDLAGYHKDIFAMVLLETTPGMYKRVGFGTIESYPSIWEVPQPVVKMWQEFYLH